MKDDKLKNKIFSSDGPLAYSHIQQREQLLPAMVADVGLLAVALGNLTRNRKAYYLVRDALDTYLCVGSSCLRDFLGHDADRALFAGAFMDRLAGCMEEGEGWPRRKPLFRVPGILAMTAAVIRLHGWVSRAAVQEGGVSTSDMVFNQLSPPRPLPKNFKRIEIKECDRREAQCALHWAKDMTPRSDYEHNLSVLIGLEAIEPNRFGLLCSLIPTAGRVLNKIAETKAETAKSTNSYIGELGQRRIFEGEVLGSTSFESQFGVTHYYRVRTEEGFVTVKSSKQWWNEQGEERGNRVKFLATIKKHREYKGRLETVVNRAVQQ